MPDVPTPPSSGARPPARRLSTEQMEAVVRRAVELQTRESDAGEDSGITEAELIRIGAELGIGPGHLRRALAEVAVQPAPAPGAGDSILGARRVVAARAVPGRAEDVRAHVERYFLERQYLAVLRRLPHGTVYEKSGGLQVELARALDATRSVFEGPGRGPRIGAGFDLRTARTVELAVRPVDERQAWISLAVDLGNQRTGYWLGVNAAGGVSAAGVAVAAGIAIAPPAALLGLPLLGSSLWGSRRLYERVLQRAQLHLEALLDHLERGESLLPGVAAPPGRRS